MVMSVNNDDELSRPLKPLPDFEGPKLEPFTDDLDAHTVEVLELIGSGEHGHVIKTKIDGKIYVIKLVSRVSSHPA